MSQPRRLAASLAAADETPPDLARCVAGLRDIAGHLQGVDVPPLARIAAL
jgi:hypothetical protein